MRFLYVLTLIHRVIFYICFWRIFSQLRDFLCIFLLFLLWGAKLRSFYRQFAFQSSLWSKIYGCFLWYINVIKWQSFLIRVQTVSTTKSFLWFLHFFNIFGFIQLFYSFEFILYLYCPVFMDKLNTKFTVILSYVLCYIMILEDYLWCWGGDIIIIKLVFHFPFFIGIT